MHGLLSILLQDSIGNEKYNLPDVRFGMVFLDLVARVGAQASFDLVLAWVSAQAVWLGLGHRYNIYG